LIWKFCKAHRPSLIERAKELQPEACEIVCRCFNNDEYRVFWNDTNIFTRHFREAGEQRRYRPQAPTVTPQQYQQALEVGVQQSGSASDLRIVKPNVWGQQELFSTDRLNLASTTNMPIYPTMAPNGYDLGLDDSRSTHEVHESAQQWAGNQQIARLSSSDPDWAQNVVFQDTLSTGIGDPIVNDNDWGDFALNLGQDYS
jgi:hypothetical protein